MKTHEWMKRAVVLTAALLIFALPGCKSGQSTEAEKSEKSSETTTASTTAEETDITTEDKAETTPEVTTEAPASDTSADPDAGGLYEKAEKYIEAAFAYYDELAETHLNLVVFDTQIEETDEGYSFVVRSQDGKDANVWFAEVKVNTSTGDMSDEWDHTWNVADYAC